MAASSAFQSIERAFFRNLNRIVEPLVRAGLGSPRIVPGGLIVLEMRGRKSGRTLRTPLVATHMGGHVIVATFRGDRSQWVANLAADPKVRYWLGGRAHEARAFVIRDGKRFRVPKSLPAALQGVVKILAPYRKDGWAFAVLSPRGRNVRCRN